MISSESTNKYRFSFTAASLMLKETLSLAGVFLANDMNWLDLNEHVPGKERLSTNLRKQRELKLRIEMMSKVELEYLLSADKQSQRLLTFLVFCRTYTFVGDFVIEVLCDKIARYDYQITDMDYITFYRHKSMMHKELGDLKDSTKHKIKQRIFTVLEQAGLIDSVRSRNIQLPVVDISLEQLLRKQKPEDLRFLLYADHQIFEI